MYDPPAYLWVITISAVVGIAAATCVVLYGGARRAGMTRNRAALLTGGAAAIFGGWLAASAVIAGYGWYDTGPGQVPWLPIAVAGFTGTLLALSRLPSVTRALTAPGMLSRLLLPHSFRVEGVVFLLYLALGRLPALFALPAGLGDMVTGLTAPLAARRLNRGGGRRAAWLVNLFGLADLTVALTLGGLLEYQLVHTHPSAAPIGELPLALIPTVGVPLLFALHVRSILTMAKAARPALAAAGARPAGAAPRAAAARSPVSRPQR